MSKNSYKKKILSSAFQKRFEEQEYFVNLFFLSLKVSFSLLVLISLIKLGYSSKVRMTRLKEIQKSFLYEKSRFKVLSTRFDDLFSLEGQQRFMKEQDQMISRDIIRVIWR